MRLPPQLAGLTSSPPHDGSPPPPYTHPYGRRDVMQLHTARGSSRLDSTSYPHIDNLEQDIDNMRRQACVSPDWLNCGEGCVLCELRRESHLSFCRSSASANTYATSVLAPSAPYPTTVVAPSPSYPLSSQTETSTMELTLLSSFPLPVSTSTTSTSSITSPSSSTPSQNTPASRNHDAAILGGAIGGGVLMVGILVALAVVLIKRSRSRRMAPSSEFKHLATQPKLSTSRDWR
ncbi:hypothetical protein FIBSPDRAFT_450769 [Athelia psychrophila]|uniref:Mid2 domain-containing protein n=1 Tax=Athelia psychrophila TaxID=1759441 RepID=A0A166M2T3_9AGAM|nr:hypothetical protein FIBSPDRAFT_450769 [Fibularhizoctonia sp. CBS 109695]